MHSDLVIQLHFLSVEQLRQAQDGGQLGQVLGHCARHGLRQRDAVQQGAQILQRAVVRQAAAGHFVRHRHQVGAILLGQCVEQAHEISLVERTKHALDRIERYFPGSIRNGLVGQ